MKKKVIIPIVLGSISLLFGGLIYLGISAFPELLLSEEQLKVQEAEKAAFYNRPVVNEEPSEGAVIFSDGAFGAGDIYVPSSIGDEEIVCGSISIGAREVKLPIELDKTVNTEFALIEYTPVFEDETFTISVNHDVVETAISENHVSYSSHFEVEDEPDNKVTKVNKAKVNKNKALRSNEAVVETSLLVIGAVDVFSMILINRRKRHLFR